MNTTSINYTPGQPTYFAFEADFVEDNVRCIPMIVRFKLDACGIKLKLSEWSRFTTTERNELADRPCVSLEDIDAYKQFLQGLLFKRMGTAGTPIAVDDQPAWANTATVASALHEKASEFGWEITDRQWMRLSNLQRFALLKLCKPGHENRNFPIAMKEFGLSE
jgi:hypothetical protein